MTVFLPFNYDSGKKFPLLIFLSGDTYGLIHVLGELPEPYLTHRFFDEPEKFPVPALRLAGTFPSDGRRGLLVPL